MRLIASTIVLALAGALLTGSAQAAVTFTSSAFDSAPTPPQVMVVDFDTIHAAGYVWAPDPTRAPITDGNGAEPAGDATNYGDVIGGASATLFMPTLASLSIYLGSIDTYNTIAFFDGATPIASFTGTDLLAPVPTGAEGNQGNGLNNRRFNFDFGGTPVNKIIFSSSQNSFEFDNIAAAAVPEPGIWVMLLAGFGMLGLAMRRRGLGAELFPA